MRGISFDLSNQSQSNLLTDCATLYLYVVIYFRTSIVVTLSSLTEAEQSMNTKLKGDSLESKFLRLLKRELLKGKFFVSADLCKVFSKKGYYSKDRAKDIVFDISVEVYMPGAVTLPSLGPVISRDFRPRG